MKCTIIDIAHALNLNRNTVSKALRNDPGVSEKTRNAVIAKAKEMDYQMVISQNEDPGLSKSTDSVLFLTRASMNYSGFWMTVMKGIEEVLKLNNYTLSLAMMDDEDIRTLHFPPGVHNPSVKGIILVELCDLSICNAALDLGLPCVSIDMPKDYESLLNRMDIVTMENKFYIHQYVDMLVSKGYRSFAFAGDIFTYNVGRGFKERYDALVEELAVHQLLLNEKASILRSTDKELMNSSTIISFLKELDELPEVYFCGNDWTAMQVMNAVQFLGYRVPEDISIIGFDNVIESSTSLPALTTVNTPKEDLGRAAARCILNRIKAPDTPHVFFQYMTNAVIRNSTNF